MTDPANALRPAAPPAAISALVGDGVVDAELAALLSLLIEGGIPVVVAGGSTAGRRAVREALLSLVPSARPIVHLAGAAEDFTWMPEAGELGWRTARHRGSRASRATGAVMVAELEPEGDAAIWGETAHLAIRALTAGYSLLATAEGSRLEDVLERLSGPPVSAIDDELARLGVVLVLADVDAPGARRRVVAAHYLRPVARDPGGHVQRQPPAALATWSEPQARFDHFAWGVVGELAARTGRRPIAFEREQAQRTASIAAAAAGS